MESRKKIILMVKDQSGICSFQTLECRWLVAFFMEIGQALCSWSRAFESGVLCTSTTPALGTAQNPHGMPGTEQDSAPAEYLKSQERMK